jgi:uncharacterized membrane protein
MMANERKAESSRNDRNTSHKAWLLFVLGFFTVFVGLVLLIIAAVLSDGNSVSFGGFIIIGPLPIVFGAGPEAPWLILLTAIITALSVITFLILRRGARR